MQANVASRKAHQMINSQSSYYRPPPNHLYVRVRGEECLGLCKSYANSIASNGDMVALVIAVVWKALGGIFHLC